MSKIENILKLIESEKNESNERIKECNDYDTDTINFYEGVLFVCSEIEKLLN